MSQGQTPPPLPVWEAETPIDEVPPQPSPERPLQILPPPGSMPPVDLGILIPRANMDLSVDALASAYFAQNHITFQPNSILWELVRQEIQAQLGRAGVPAIEAPQEEIGPRCGDDNMGLGLPSGENISVFSQPPLQG